MRQKLLLVALIISLIGIISGCQKEINNDDTNTVEMVRKKSFDPEAIKANSLKYREMIEKIDQQIKETMPAIRQTIENLKLERSQLSNSGLMKKGKHGKAVIHIPADYPTLQEAVDNAPSNGKILVKGAVSDIGNVIIDDVPGLTIQGENNSATINGGKLIITAAGVTVKDLTINMAIVISGSSNETIIDNKITSMANTTGFDFIGYPFDMAVLIDQSVNCIVKNNTIKGSDNNLAIHFGIFINKGSRHTIESNDVSFYAIRIPNTIFFEGIHGNESNNNKISNCNIKSNLSPDVINSFGIYLTGSGNQVSGCKAESVSGPFVLIGNNNQVNDCEARIFIWSGFEANGNNNKIKNCKANGSYSNGEFGLRGFASLSGEKNIFENCDAKNNEVGLQLGSEGAPSNSGHRISNCNSYSNNFYGVFLYKSTLCTLQENDIKLNGVIGINLVEVSNSKVLRNKSKYNITCDFNQTNCTGNTVAFNQFGTSCTQLPWVGPF